MPRKRTPEEQLMEQVMREFRQGCAALAPLRPGGRLLLGCSAGGDSMALLDLVMREAPAQGWGVALAHLDHRQRPESAEEAAFVAEQGAERGVPVFIEHLDPRTLPTRPLSEDAMRQARHRCFRRFSALWEADALLLAHQADDQAETFCIRLLAGSGPTGLAGIRRTEEVGGLNIARPLLGVRRAALRDYLRARRLPWHDDPTNEHQTNKRGWVRHALLPGMAREMGYDPTELIARAAGLLEQETKALENAAALMLRELTAMTTEVEPIGGREPEAQTGEQARVLGTLNLGHHYWQQAGTELRLQLLREWLWKLQPRPHPPLFKAVQEALAFAERGKPGASLRTINAIQVEHHKKFLLARCAG